MIFSTNISVAVLDVFYFSRNWYSIISVLKLASFTVCSVALQLL